VGGATETDPGGAAAPFELVGLSLASALPYPSNVYMKHCGLIVSAGSGLFHGNRPRAEAVKTLAAETTFMRGSGARADACRVGFAGIASRGPRLLAKRPQLRAAASHRERPRSPRMVTPLQFELERRVSWEITVVQLPIAPRC
jgi:hypothetical protein